MINFHHGSLPLVVFAFLYKPYNSPNDQSSYSAANNTLDESSHYRGFCLKHLFVHDSYLIFRHVLKHWA